MKSKPRRCSRISLYSLQASGRKCCGVGPSSFRKILRNSSGELTKTAHSGPIRSLKTGPSSRCLLSTYSCSLFGPPAIARNSIVPKNGIPRGSGGFLLAEVAKSLANVRDNARFFLAFQPMMLLAERAAPSSFRMRDRSSHPRSLEKTLNSPQ